MKIWKLFCFFSIVSMNTYCLDLLLSNLENKPDCLIAIPCGHQIPPGYPLNTYCPEATCSEKVDGKVFSPALREYLRRAMVQPKIEKQSLPCFACVKDWRFFSNPNPPHFPNIQPRRRLTLEIEKNHPFLKKVYFNYYELPKGHPNKEWLQMKLYFKEAPEIHHELEEFNKYGLIILGPVINADESMYVFSTTTPDYIAFDKGRYYLRFDGKDRWIKCFEFGLKFLNKYAHFPPKEQAILKEVYKSISHGEL